MKNKSISLFNKYIKINKSIIKNKIKLFSSKYYFDDKTIKKKELIDNNIVTIHFKFDNKEFNKNISVKAKIGDSLLDVYTQYNFNNMGVCGGQLSCATCHCVLPKELFDQTQELSYEEEDLLDTAYGTEDNSRLGCQITITKCFDNKVIRIPDKESNNKENIL